MPNTLFLVCPTDSIESIINRVCKRDNYFYTSLGNSCNTNYEDIQCIKDVVVKHTIKEIYFVLSSDNKIILDALEGQCFLETQGLKKIYLEVIGHKSYSEVVLRRNVDLYSIFSLYLNKKIKELEFELSNITYYPIMISGKIYDRNNNIFKNTFSNSYLMSLQKHYLN